MVRNNGNTIPKYHGKNVQFPNIMIKIPEIAKIFVDCIIVAWSLVLVWAALSYVCERIKRRNQILFERRYK